MTNCILDMGGVLMKHNMSGCIDAFVRLMGEENLRRVLGLQRNGEGGANSLMEAFECGETDEDTFIATLLQACPKGTAPADITAAWNRMHAGIPQWKLDFIRRLHDRGNAVLLLSNSNPIHQRDIEQNYDMQMFDRCFYSHHLHAHKPEPAIYEAVQQYLCSQHWEQRETIFIDDIAINRLVGERFGWTTFASLEEWMADRHL